PRRREPSALWPRRPATLSGSAFLSAWAGNLTGWTDRTGVALPRAGVGAWGPGKGRATAVEGDMMEPMPEDWERAVAVVAHPDDLEYGAAAAVARWTGQGKHVAYVLATEGEAGIEGMAPDLVGPLRVDEERRSAALVGVTDVDFLGHTDGLVEYGVPLR